MDQYVSKPFQRQQLLEAIHSVCPISRTRNTPQAVIASEKKGSGDVLSEPTDSGNVLVLDRGKIMERLAGSMALLDVVTQMFQAGYPEQIRNIESAIRDEDGALLEKSAHTLKGTIGNFTEEGPYRTASLLEQSGRNHAFDQTPLLASRLKQELQALQRALLEIQSSVSA